METPICKVCGRPKEYHEGGTRKDGTSYDSFWGCPDWKDTIHKNAKEKWQKKQEQPKKPEIGWDIIADEIKALRDKDAELDDRIDSAGKYVISLEARIKKLENN